VQLFTPKKRVEIVRSLHYNGSGGAFLVTFYGGLTTPLGDKGKTGGEVEWNLYELWTLSGASGVGLGGGMKSAAYGLTGQGDRVVDVVWYDRDRFAVLTTKKQLNLMRENSIVMTLTGEHHAALRGVEHIFVGPAPGHILIGTRDRVVLFDVEGLREVGGWGVKDVREVIYSAGEEHVALVGQHEIWVLGREVEGSGARSEMRFTMRTRKTETQGIKSGIWDSTLPVFFYMTWSHMKFVLVSGTWGIVKSVEVPVYLVSVQGRILTAVDGQGAVVRSRLERLEVELQEALRTGEMSRAREVVALH
jgi:hypothetical protein